MGGGGKGGSSSTSTVSIPPEVLARYNSVNAQAQAVAATPFQPYTGQFVAGLTPTQQAGIQNTNTAAGLAQPYYGAAVQGLNQAQQQATPGINQAYSNVYNAQNIGTAYAGGAETAYNQAAQMSQPYNQAATEYTLAGSQGISPGQLQTGRYFDPFAQTVAGSTYAALQQQQGQERNQLAGQQAASGAFGGDRAGLARANLARQQELATAQAISPIYSQAYQNALQTAQQQQGVGLSAAQANRAALSSTGQQLAGLGQQQFGQGLQLGQAYGGLGQQQFGQGMTAAQQQAALANQVYGMGSQTAQGIAGIGTAAQQAALQGAQQQLAAGTAEQQTQQADLTAQYQQFLQQQGYPFQVAQFLANIAMGTGALSGSTTSSTSTGGGGFFSDERLKHDVKKIGKTNDGQPIYSYKYKGDDRTQIGLMAQDVEKKHPDAVGVMGGYKTVDYKKATEDAERPHRASGGVIPSSMGGVVMEPGLFALGGHYAGGGLVDAEDMKAIIASQKAGLGPFAAAGPYGGAGAPGGGAKGIVPQASLPTPKLITAQPPQRPNQPSGLAEAAQTGKNISELYKMGKEGLGKVQEWSKSSGTPAPAGTPTPTPRPAGLGTDTRADLPSAKAKDASIPASDDATGYKLPGANDNLPTDNLQPQVTPPDSTEGLEGFFAYGGVIPRAHKSVGGINIYGTQPGFDYFPEDVMKSGEEEASQAEGQFKKSTSGGGAGGGGGGGSGLGAAIGTAANLATIGKGVGSFMSWLPTLFAKDGGAIPRHGYAVDGTVTPDATGVVAPSATVDDSGGGGDDSTATPSARQYMDYIVNKKGEAPHVAAAMLGNAYHESGGLNPTILGDRGKAYGLFQVHEAGEQPAFRQWAAENKRNASDPYAQIDFVHDRLNGPYASTLEAMRNAPDAATAAEHFMRGYERPKAGPTEALSARTYFANKLAAGEDLPINMKGLGGGDTGARSFGATYSGVNPKEAGFGDVARSILPESIPTSENFVVPALSFLGSMLSSRNPTFGGALGEGLVGGVSGYMNLQKQQLERAKEVVDYFKQNYTLIGPDKFRGPDGQVYSGSQLQGARYNAFKSMGVDPKIFGVAPPSTPAMPTLGGSSMQPTKPAGALPAPAQPGAAQPVQPGAAPSAPAGAPQAPDKPNLFTMNKQQLKQIAETRPDIIPGAADDPNFNIAQIRKSATDLLAQAEELKDIAPDKYANLVSQANALNEMVDKRLEAAVKGQDEQNTKIREASSKTYADYKNEVDNRAGNYDAHEAKLRRLADINADYQSGALESAKQKLISYAKGTPLENLIPQKLKDQPGQYGEAYKIALQEAMQAMAQDKMVRAPKVGVEKEMARVPSPDSDPAAVYSILGSTWGDLLRQKQMDADFAKAPVGTNPGDFARQWSAAHEANKFYRDAYSQITPNPDISKEAIKSLQHTYRGPQGEVFSVPTKTSGAGAATSETQAAPAAPQLPEPLRNMEGLVFSPSRKQYRDSSGNIYDMTGKRVQ